MRAEVIVIGSGAGGLMAALTAADAGLKTILLEKTHLVGGTTALSEGMIWVPANSHAQTTGAIDSADEASRYLLASAPDTLDSDRANAYCSSAAGMLDFLESKSGVRYELATASIDYHAELPGATRGIRSLRLKPFDGRSLGPWFARLRPPLATTMAWGGMMLSSPDYQHVLAMRRSLRSFTHVARLAARFGWDRLTGKARGTRLTNGNALVAGLLEAVQRSGVTVLTDATAESLVTANGAVTGVRVREGATVTSVGASRGVVLACGGFPGDPAMQRQFLPHVAVGKEHVTLAPQTNTGDGLRLAVEAGARIRDHVSAPVAWTPASLVPQPKGPPVPFPHYVDRAKPGVLAVTPEGRRFCNEADSYHCFVPEMIKATASSPRGCVWLIADARAVRAYGLGAAPPAPGRISPFVRNGYLLAADSIAALADRLAAPRDELLRTIERYNADAAVGVDRDFGKGRSALNRAYGDASWEPNPCVGPLVEPPFYAVRLFPGDIGTFVGLDVDANARVRGERGPIPGLYAAGNDVASPTGGDYPAAGVTVGAALTFGFLAGRSLAARASEG